MTDTQPVSDQVLEAEALAERGVAVLGLLANAPGKLATVAVTAEWIGKAREQLALLSARLDPDTIRAWLARTRADAATIADLARKLTDCEADFKRVKDHAAGAWRANEIRELDKDRALLAAEARVKELEAALEAGKARAWCWTFTLNRAMPKPPSTPFLACRLHSGTSARR